MERYFPDPDYDVIIVLAAKLRGARPYSRAASLQRLFERDLLMNATGIEPGFRRH